MDINEIARLAGVSRATVSRYLNDGYVSQEKRRLISRVIQETGYVPSQSAQQLRTGKTDLVSIIIPKVFSHSVGRMLSGITETFAGTTYHTVLHHTNNDPDEELRCLRAMGERQRSDGIIYMATVITAEHLEALKMLSMPIVILGQQIDGYSCVYHDDYRATFEVSKVALRHAQCPGYIGAREDDVAVGEMRHRGFADACRAVGIEPKAEASVIGDFTVESGYLCCEQLLETMPQIDAIVCATDHMAYGAITCLREYGRKVPDDVRVAGVGDSELSRILMPSVTSVHLFQKTSGREAAKMLLDAMDKGDDIPRQLKMGYEVYSRNSTI